MIHINELMLGDWVMDVEKPAQVTSLTCDGIIETTRRISNIELIEPIPLTPEILEKNGFTDGEYRHYCGFVWKYKADGFREIRLIMQPNGAILFGEKIKKDYPIAVGDEFRVPNLEYVHQLQNALRLCQIDKTIEL